MGEAGCRDALTMLRAKLYFSFRSPYSYLAIGRYHALAQSHELSIHLRPVYPLAIRDPGFFARINPLAMDYVQKDIARIADYLDLPFRWPQPDPVVQNLETREVAQRQPHIHRITRLGQVASRHGKGVAFAAEAAKLIWGGTQNWHEGMHLAGALQRAELDPETCEIEAQKDAETLDAEIADNEKALNTAGHWGVPTLVFQGEPFFGQDRFEHAVWRMKQEGLKPR